MMMKLAHRLALVAATVAAFAIAAPAVMSAAKAPVIVRKDRTFGRILLTPGHKALYYWGVEKQAGRIVCTATCLKRWPPLIVRSRAAVPRRLADVKGAFGVVRRPDGRLQVTYKGLALYAYADDPRDQVLCNNFDHWFVVRV